MIEAVLSSFSTEGLPWIALAAFVAGVVRGFSGFGTAMIFLPVATQFISPFAAITALIVMDIIGPLPIARKAWHDAHQKDLMRLLIGMIVVLPFAIYGLSLVAPEVFRYFVSILSLCMLVILLLGIRYRGEVRATLVYLVGGFAGFTGGFGGLPGPPVIMFYMASPHGPKVIRANNMLFLLGFDVAMLVCFALMGKMSVSTVAVGILLIAPIMLGNMLGAYFFDPAKEKLYRYIAYVVIAISALNGLPLFD